MPDDPRSPDERFEDGLVAAIEPIRQFALASVSIQFFESGLFALLAEAGPLSAEQVSRRQGWDPDRTRALLCYLAVEDLVQVTAEDGPAYSVAPRAEALQPYLSWYQLLIRGYAPTFLGLSDALAAGAEPTERDLPAVGTGSCGMSHFDAIPLTRRLMGKVDPAPTRIVDLGCGNGGYIAELCAVMPSISALGIEPSPIAAEDGNRIIAELGYADRARVIAGDAHEVLIDGFDFEPDCFILGFVLQEILGQIGRTGVIEFLRAVHERYPTASVVVIEVDNRHGDIDFMRRGLARAYYNPYYLIHPFTGQRLETREYWLQLFAEAGYAVVAENTTSADVDSTGLELGFLLQRSTTGRDDR